MVRVKIRSIEEDKSVFLCEVPWQELEALVREIGRWGVHDGKNTETIAVGQFVVEHGEAYFEVIFGED